MSRYLGGGPQSVWARGAQLVLVLGVWVAALTMGERGDGPGVTRFIIAFFAAAAAASVLHRRGRPAQSLPARSDDVAVVGSAATVGVAGGGLLALVLDHRASAVVLACGWAASFLGLLMLRGIIRQLFRRTNGQRVAVIGVGEDAHEVTGLILDHPEINLEFVGVVGDLTTAERNGLDNVWLGPIDRLSELLTIHEVDVAMITTTGFRSPQFRHILGVLRQSGVEPMLSTGIARLDSGSLRVSSVVHEPLVSIVWSEPSKAYYFAKRAIDIIGAGLGLLLAIPFMLAAALFIKLDDRGPVFYWSPRVGMNNAEFGMLKLRSMKVNAHEEHNELAQRNERSGPLFKMSNDPRVTRAGRLLRETSIDELPQLVNVLRGQMSLVGPRPALPDEAAAFDEELRTRFALRPGVTGLWQVEARSNANFSAYRRLDLHYVANQSLLLDIQILIATAVQVMVATLLLPVTPFIRNRSGGEAIELAESASVIDLRARLAQNSPSDSGIAPQQTAT